MTYFIGKTFTHSQVEEQISAFETCYKFIEQYDVVPSSEKILLTIKQSRDLFIAVNKVNTLFAKALKRALLCSLDKEQARCIKDLLTVEIDIDKETLATTEIRVKYGDINFTNPIFEQLIYLCEVLQVDAKATWYNGIRFQDAIQMNVTREVAAKIKEVVEEGICEPTVDSSGGNSQTLIIEMNFIADVAQSNTNFYEYQEHIWQVLTDFNEVLGDMRKFQPSYLILYASDEN